MYYREKIIDGILCFQTIPNGKWHQLGLEQLTNRIVNLRKEVDELNVKLENK